MAKHKRNARDTADNGETLAGAETETTTLEAESPRVEGQDRSQDRSQDRGRNRGQDQGEDGDRPRGKSHAAERASAGARQDDPDTGAGAADGSQQSTQSADPQALARELEEARRSATEAKDAMLRARAELENVRKRAEREVDSARKFALERFMSELLAVRDSMELGLSAARDGETDIARLREGMELTLKLFDTASAKFGLEEVDPQGEAFDPDLHQAMSMQESADADSGTVITVVQKGYKLNDRLLRPAMVIVAK